MGEFSVGHVEANASPARRFHPAWLLAGAAIVALPAAPAFAIGTSAGTQINNTATATYELPGGTDTSVNSNTVSLTVDELLDVVVNWEDPANVVTLSPSVANVLAFSVTNSGNGSEAFTLSVNAAVAGDDFNPTAAVIYLDTNNNDLYDVGTDTVYVPGTNDPVIAADGNITVFVLSVIPGLRLDDDEATVTLSAEAKTGTGAPGTTFAGLGQGGGNAVVGASGAEDEDNGTYVVNTTSVSLAKSAVVLDPFGGTTRVPESVITYTIVATVTGTGTLNNLRIADAIPSGSTYVPGTITLQGNPLTDANDADAGRFTGTGIAWGLGNVASGATRTVTFKVEIN